MNHEVGFLQAIVEEPDDDAVRLIYADWLEDHDRAERAEFIRVQIELASLDDYDPRRGALQSREAELLAQHQTEWIGSQGSLRVQFRRGFPDSISMDANTFLKEGDRLFENVPLRFADLHNVGGYESQLVRSSLLTRLRELRLQTFHYPMDVAAILAAPNTQQLHGLHLHLHSLDSPTVHALTAPGRQWRRLSLEHCPAGLADFESLAGSAALASVSALELNHCSLSDVVLEVMSEVLKTTQLNRLSMYRNQIGTAGVRTLARTGALKTVTDLDLGFNSIGNAGVEALAHSGVLANLQRLRLSHNRLTASAAQALAASPHLKQLTVLDLNVNNLGVEGARALARSANFASLRELDLTGNEIGDGGAEALGASPHLTSLRWLGAGVNGLRVAGVKALITPGKLSQLHRLDLHSNCLEDMGLQVLARCPHLAGVRWLDLHANKIGSAGIKDLAAFRHLVGLRELDLGHNRIDDEAALALFGSPLARQLTHLDLSVNDVTSAALPALQKLLTASPRLRVSFGDSDMNETDRQVLKAEYRERIEV